MKKLSFLTLALLFMGLICSAQQHVLLPAQMNTIKMDRQIAQLEAGPVSHLPIMATQKSNWPPEEDLIGNSYFDLQSNSSMQNRLYLFSDGTMGATFTFGAEYDAFPDRGTAYNYFDGSDWSEPPIERIESQRTGWPAYAPFGENGEIIVAHISGGDDEGLLFNSRNEKGTGIWNEWLYTGPVGNEALTWPRMSTSGIDNSTIHLIALTLPTANGGSTYNGQDGALLYSRSVDGGTNWDIQNLLFDDLNIDNYLGFSGDTYEIQAQGDNVAVLIGDPWIDLILMKSEDGGDSWNKTIVWENPYPMWTSGTVTDTFYCADGSHSLAFDMSGKVHLTFGINRALSADGSTQSWFPFVDGVAYWNEDMDVFSNDLHALDPYGHPDSELIENVNLIGWTQDVDEDGEITFVGNTTDNIGTYQLGLSSMPQIIADDNGFLVAVWSSVTETFENGTKNYRHLWCRVSTDNGVGWSDFYDLTSDLPHTFDECVWPAMASESDDYFYLIYQLDQEPGLAVRFEEHGYVENSINFMKTYKFGVGIGEKNTIDPVVVGDNFPNPFSVSTKLTIELTNPAEVQIALLNSLGQVVYTKNTGNLDSGQTLITIPRGSLNAGVYICTIKVGDHLVKRKFIIE